MSLSNADLLAVNTQESGGRMSANQGWRANAGRKDGGHEGEGENRLESKFTKFWQEWRHVNSGVERFSPN